MVLYDIVDDVEFVKVIIMVFCVEGFFERDLNVVDVVMVLSGIEEGVIKLKNENVFDYFFVKIVIDMEEFIFFLVGFE